MTGEERLARLHAELRGLALPCLVMGGHAIRFYGIERLTVGYDVHLAPAPEAWKELPAILSRTPVLAGIAEGPSWRPLDFRRFRIGTLPDGKEEWLDCWRANHLLAPYPDLYARRSEGPYGGGVVAFLGIDDLIRSKETVRDEDWADVLLLEEIADQRRLSAAVDEARIVAALATLRSRRGLELAEIRGCLRDPSLVKAALGAARNPITRAILGPWAGADSPEILPGYPEPIQRALRGVRPGSTRHVALVEAVRRLYQRAAMQADRADKARAAAAS